MNGLTVKNVTFNGSSIKAIKYPAGDIYVGMANVCDSIGFKKTQRDRFIKTAKADEIYEEGIHDFKAGEFDAKHPIVAIKLDYLPLWLCKMRINQQTRLQDPKLYDNLKQYQLLAKDVLANAFLPEHSTAVSVQKAEAPSAPVIDATMVATMLNTMTELTNEVRRIGNALENLKVVKKPVQPVVEGPSEEEKRKARETREFDPKKRKITIEKKSEDIVKYSKGKYEHASQVLSDVYGLVGSEYKINWYEEINDLVINKNMNGVIGLIDVIVNNNTYFDAVIDLLNAQLPESVRNAGKRNHSHPVKRYAQFI